MPPPASQKKKETVWTKAKNEAKYQDEGDWCASCAWCCICCNMCDDDGGGGGGGGFMSFGAPADSEEKLPAILISPGFSHVFMERD